MKLTLACSLAILLLGGTAKRTKTQDAHSAQEDIQASKRIGEAVKLDNDDKYDTIIKMLDGKQWNALEFYVVSQRGKALTLLILFKGTYLLFTADCSTGCGRDMMPPEDDWAYATLEHKGKADFWLYTKPAERKYKWTYWNITSLSFLPQK